jgi:peptidylprolyl isomerase
MGLALGTATLLCGTAGAAGKEHASSGTRGLPAVRHATSLSSEPVVRGDRSKPRDVLVTKDLVTGSGATATSTSTVTIKYVGANYRNGKDFTSSTWTTGKAATFSLTRVVAGFAQGVAGMKVGGRREIVIPPALGYGDHAVGPISKNETLVFVVDLQSVNGA